nr:MAG TPA: hypothetical protein [Caudoviricetes sp.]
MEGEIRNKGLLFFMPVWWNGRHDGFRFHCSNACVFESRHRHH